MKILVENSGWGNVGEAWYRISLYELLKKLYPNDDVYCGEGPIYRSFRVKNNWEKNNGLNLFDYQSADVYIYSGPILPQQLLSIYANRIKQIILQQKSYALISVSGTALSQREISEIGDFLQKYPPLFFSSRDEETYNAFKPYVKNAYNGVCTAFLVDKTIDIHPFKLDKEFFISSFYTELEPIYSIPAGKSFNIENLLLERHKTMFGLPYDFARHLNFLRKQQKEIDGHLIVRTVQNLNTKYNHVNFAMPNSFISFNPISYLNVTKSAEFVVSDRVHACAIALACGRPARFLFNTPRAGIFDRMGFNYKKNNGIMYPNMNRIDEEKYLLEQEIKKYI